MPEDDQPCAGISVVIPTFRRPEGLAELLASIEAQTLPPDEVIVVDDCSPQIQAYQSVIERYSSRIRRLRYHRFGKNLGAPSARNAGVTMARQEWISLVDDDDLWLPRKTEVQWSLAKSSDAKVGLIHSWADVIHADGTIEPFFRHRDQGDDLATLLRSNYICSPTVTVRKRALAAAGGFDTAFPSCQDWDAWVSVLERGFTARVAPEVLAHYRKHDQPSIGMSPNARRGYAAFHRKHFFFAMRKRDLRFLVRAVRFWLP